MGIKLGNLNISDIYLGSTKIVSVYQGSTLIWGGDVPPVEEPFYVTSDEDFTVCLSKAGSHSRMSDPEYQDPTDREWKSMVVGQVYSYPANTKVHIRGTREYWSYSLSAYYYLSTNCTFKKIGGNILSLVNYTSALHDSSFNFLFGPSDNGNKYIEDASELDLSKITSVPKNCFRNFFNECSNLKFACSLPTVDIVYGSSGGQDGGYRSMFCLCTSLQNIPALKVTSVVAYYGCRTMFANCSQLVFSTTQTEQCPYPFSTPRKVDYTSFTNMFYGTQGYVPDTPEEQTTYYTSVPVI